MTFTTTEARVMWNQRHLTLERGGKGHFFYQKKILLIFKKIHEKYIKIPKNCKPKQNPESFKIKTSFQRSRWITRAWSLGVSTHSSCKSIFVTIANSNDRQLITKSRVADDEHAQDWGWGT